VKDPQEPTLLFAPIIIVLFLRLIGITDYEVMFADVIKSMKSMHGISKAQVVTMRPRRGASYTVTGVDLHYMTNFSQGIHFILYFTIFIAFVLICYIIV
jgi:hypothetical protein